LRFGARDPAFAGLPFDHWLSGSGETHIHWSMGLTETTLSAHQRFATRLFAEVDGRELARRRGAGTLLVLFQISDGHGHYWQNHQEMDLEKVEQGISANDAVFSELFFVLPGDYLVAAALYDTATREHSMAKKHLHVGELKNDPLPDAWNDLPAVEFVGPATPPDGWYLPGVQGTLRLKAAAREPEPVSVLVNLTPSERLTGSSRIQSRNLSWLLPSAKIFSFVDWGESPFELALLDLTRRKVPYRQAGGKGIEWSQAVTSLQEVNPGIIDVESLQNRWYAAQFFLDQVAQTINRTPKHKAVIILSSPVEFVGGQDTRPLTSDLTSKATVYYVRYDPLFFYGRGRGRGVAPSGAPPIDQIAGLLKPLEPRVFEVTTAAQFRKSLATILAEIAKH
jgi:hypothetical protein